MGTEAEDRAQYEANQMADHEAEMKAAEDAMAQADIEAEEQASYDLMQSLKARTVAIVRTAPDRDAVVKALFEESQSILRFALGRVITINADLTSATEDLSLIAKLKKAIEEKRKEYVGPIREKLDSVNGAFKALLEPIEQADKITRTKILEFRQEQERKRQEAERIEQEKIELARREAALKGGEITVDLTPIEKPEAVPDKVHTDLGSAGTMTVWKYEVIDFKTLPDEYKIPNIALLTSVVKASKGKISIPGLRIYSEETLRVTTK